MTLPPALRSFIPLLIGLIVGAVGAVLFIQSLPGGEGSPEERANRLEVELQRAKNRIASLEGGAATQDRSDGGILGRFANARNRRQIADGTRRIAEDLKDGRPVTPDDVFRASQPLLRDLAPLFDRMRVKEQQAMVDSMTGELSRKYRLTPEKQQQLKNWFQQKSEENAQKWSELVAKDGTRLQDIMQVSRNVRPDEGLDGFMQTLLPPEQRTAFNNDRLAQRAERVQNEADRQVQQLDAIATLDENQRDQVFGIMARSSKDYSPAMALQGVVGQPIGGAAVADRQAATLAVLRPDQRAAYDAEQGRRREEAAKDMEAIGLTLPPDWQMMSDGQ